MAEYIEREAAHRMVAGLIHYSWKSPISTECRSTLDADDVNFGLDKIPAAEVASVVHGRWIPYNNEQDKGFHYCSVCKTQAFNYEDGCEVVEVLSKFCHDCGAKMDMEQE